MRRLKSKIFLPFFIVSKLDTHGSVDLKLYYGRNDNELNQTSYEKCNIYNNIIFNLLFLRDLFGVLILISFLYEKFFEWEKMLYLI